MTIQECSDLLWHNFNHNCSLHIKQANQSNYTANNKYRQDFDSQEY